MTTEQMAQMSEQLQQLGQQLSDQQEMLQQVLETQRRQSQVQMETLINLGAAQVAKTTSDALDFQTKAFSEMRGVKSDENAWSGWVYKFRIEAAGCFRQVAAIQDWAENRHGQSISRLRPSRNRGGRLRNLLTGDMLHTNADALPRLKEARSAVQTQVHWPLLLVWRTRSHEENSPVTAKFHAGKAETRAARVVRELCSLRSGQIRMRKQCVAPSVPSADMKSAASEIGKPGKGSRNRRFANRNPARVEDLVPMHLTLRRVREST